ncbi:MAG: hypothetical protein IT221_04955 [Fluviicola sp.]|nr:hypothetical protein [Fluviicola sp.]
MKKINLFLASLAFASISFGQKVMLTEGDLSALKGETFMKIEYDYSSMEVGDFNDEGSYTKKKVEEYNAKEAGKGDKWLESWERDKTVRYPEKFEELINKTGTIKYSQDAEGTKYTLIVKTRFIEPGFNAGVMKRPAAVSFEYIIVETGNPSKVIARMSHKLVPGAQAMGFDYDTGTRIAESYAKGGKMLAAFITKSTK